MAPEPMRVLLRIFARATDAAGAADVGRRLRHALRAWSAAETLPPQPYWKMPELVEYTFELLPAVPATYDAVVALAEHGWTHVEREIEFDSVWNAGRGSEFLVAEATWAELLLCRQTQAHVLYLRSNQVALSREAVSDWRELQALHADYMASLGPWTLAEILEHFATQFGGDDATWPLSRAQVEHFMTAGVDPVVKSVQQP